MTLYKERIIKVKKYQELDFLVCLFTYFVQVLEYSQPLELAGLIKH